MAAAMVTERVETRLKELISIPSMTGLENEAILYFRKKFEDMKAEEDHWRESMKVLQQHPSFPGKEVPDLLFLLLVFLAFISLIGIPLHSLNR
jgi:hypothetical protein